MQHSLISYARNQMTQFKLRLVGVMAIAGFVVNVAYPQTNPPCPNTICGPMTACGGQTSGIAGAPPGPMSFCSQSQVNLACEYCDGTTSFRLCAPLGTGGRECTLVAAANLTQCGAPKKGKCTKYNIGNLVYYYCKKTSGDGTVTCTNAQECNADTACKTGS